MIQIRHTYSFSYAVARIRAMAVLLLLLFGMPSTFADDETTPRITIGGSVYGGGLRGAINTRTVSGNEVEGSGTTSVTIYEGEIGSADAVAEGNGNVFGGGFGPAARVLKTSVTLKGGTVWNSIYGGGEIAAVGIGYMDPPIDKIPIFRYVERQGCTNVEMYRGHVKRDVFGGGRGYSYASDDGSFGDERFYTDGYVFGSTKVRIYGGTIGTEEGVADGYGNVFGGGDVGFLYSGNERKVVGEGVAGVKDVNFLEKGKPYYVIPSGKPDSFFAKDEDKGADRVGDLSIACDVLIEPWCRVKSGKSITVHDLEYTAGEYIPTEELDYLVYKTAPEATPNSEWSKLEDDGIIIYNAVFAGGNVSTGDDKVYAETTTVQGNVTATVNDLYYRDLITIGTEHIGGLYGDGNLTFADGYRELSLSCYGTDYYNLQEEVTTSVYDGMLPREQAYYQMKYRCKETYGSTYKAGDIIAEGVYSRMTDEDKAHWEKAGFRSKYAGRLLNTIQRADFVGVFGSRLVLQGAMDRVLNKEGDELKFEDYTLNRIGELSLNKQHAPGVVGDNPDPSQLIGNYFGIYNQVNYLGALTSDVRFSEDDQWSENESTGARVDGGIFYSQWKINNYNDSRQKNIGNSENLIALASGVALELKEEPTASAPNNWGIITGVIQLDLINVTQGEGGGFVYARNEHGSVSRKFVENSTQPYVRKFLSSYNRDGEAATHEEYYYTESSLQDIQTSGNFVLSPRSDQYIVDDCYPVHNKKIGGDAHPDEAHYWYIRGNKYVYNQHISVYTGAAKKYQVSKGIELATGVTNAKLTLQNVYPGYYCNIADDAPSIYVDDVEYKYGDPMNWWDYQKLVQAGDANADKFSPDTDTDPRIKVLNNMTHDNGFLLTLEFDDPALNFWKPTTLVTSPDNSSQTELGPSFRPTEAGAYGQHKYLSGSYIPESEVIAYNQDLAQRNLPNQATVASAPLEGYQLCLESLQLTSGGSLLLIKGELVADADIPGLKRKYMAIMSGIPEDQVDPATNDYRTDANEQIDRRLTQCYKVESDGYYGGKYYEAGGTYNALDGWGLLVKDDSKNDREHWTFNNDALDLLAPPSKYQQNSYTVDNETRTTDVVGLTASPQAIISLYMSRDSRLLDLRKDKNLTAHFRYTYTEGEGESQASYTEDHYINITVEFKDELPDVGDLETPDIELPGTKIAFKQPTVVAGAYNIAGGGWEYYTNKEDAVGHIGGTKFTNRETPFYWYQDGYWVNYYASTMVGRQYSKEPIQIKIANYHDLKRVVEDTEYFLGIGMRKTYPEGTPEADKQRSPKIYINDYSSDDKSGLDMLRTLFEKTYDVSEVEKLGTVPGLRGLEIYLRNDLAPKDSWSTIGTDEQCFGGNLHGDGYTISGLTTSLFHKICNGNVYNLGVTGSFATSGIADTNNGSIQNCWVYTTGSPSGSTKPLGNGGTIVNCYYNIMFAPASNSGALRKDDNAFYNGNVAYELNGFFLKHKSKASEGNLDNLTSDYVANRFADGDFIYANGSIPTEKDSRWVEDTPATETQEATGHYVLKDPGDYLFFGQRLNYGYIEGEGNEHQDYPTRIDESLTNRVYRTPAYFQNATPAKAYYNKAAVFASQSADGVHSVYPGMTAIDFTGHDQPTWVDHEGLTSFMNTDLTRNLLVYVPSDGATTQTVIQNYLDTKEPTYQELAKTTAIGKHSVGIVPEATISAIKGHAVYKNGESYTTAMSHFLVDGQDFFAPIAYNLGTNMRMWYQRKPLYVDRQAGWEVVSLPFTADLVTTNQKGEITHFYKTPEGNQSYGDQSKGHEYWLREYNGKGSETLIEGYNYFEGEFDYPAAVSSNSKTDENTFLWDYYYSKSSRQDVNTDEYQTYYKIARTFTGYPYITAGKPYLIGFPGARYYEFDLSGQFSPEYTKEPFAGNNAYVTAQTITFASAAGGTVPASDMMLVEGVDNQYGFQANFISSNLEAGYTYYMIDDEGLYFEKVSTEGTKTMPFRPYFKKEGAAGTRRSDILGIIFGVGGLDNAGNDGLTSDVEETAIDEPEELNIHAEGRRIIVRSTLREKKLVRIVNMSGIVVRTFTIAPGETIETPVSLSGIYIVNHKKIAVK